MNDKNILEKHILQFVRLKKINRILTTGPTVLFCSFLFSIVFSLLALLGYLHWYLGLVVLLFPLIILILSILFKQVNLLEFTQELDQDISAKQTLSVFYEMIVSKNTDNMYYNILKDRIFLTFSQVKPESVYNISLDTKSKLALFTIIPALLFSIYAFTNRIPLEYELATLDVQEAAVQLAVREDLEEMFSTEIDRLHQLEENMNEEKENTPLIEDSINNLTMEITKQLSALRRDSLTALIEEKKIDPSHGLNLDKLMDNKFTPDESRDFILDLLSDENISKNQRSSIQKSYEDFVSDPENKNTESLAEDLLDSFDPKTGEKAEALENAVSSLKDALDKLNSSQEKENENNMASSQSGRKSQQQGPGIDGMEDSDSDNGASNPTAGTEDNKSDNQDSFNPLESSGIEAHLPEGQIIIDSDKGILRMEADEELILERSKSIYNTTPFEEGIIRGYDIPDNMKKIVKEYFTLIGGIILEE
jgi:hypothetical protein